MFYSIIKFGLGAFSAGGLPREAPREAPGPPLDCTPLLKYAGALRVSFTSLPSRYSILL